MLFAGIGIALVANIFCKITHVFTHSLLIAVIKIRLAVRTASIWQQV